MDQSLEARRKLYWALILVMGLAEIIVIIANRGMHQLYDWRTYDLGLGPDLYLLEIRSLLCSISFALPAAMAFCMSRISLLAMQTEPERAKTHKNDAMAYLVLMAFMLMFCLLETSSYVLHVLKM
jgi:hypothetical protein